MLDFGSMIEGNFWLPLWDYRKNLVRRSGSGIKTIDGKKSEQIASNQTAECRASDSFTIGQWDAGLKKHGPACPLARPDHAAAMDQHQQLVLVTECIFWHENKTAWLCVFGVHLMRKGMNCVKIQRNPTCEATPFCTWKVAFNRGGISSGVEINILMFTFALSSDFPEGLVSHQDGLSKGVLL